MSKKKAGMAVAALAVLGLGLLFYRQMVPGTYVPAGDEIALHIQLDTKEDIGLLVYDYCADGHEYSGGISNADGSLLGRGSDLTVVWKKAELGSSADAAALSVQFRIITEYTAPNYENIYPEDITEYIAPISWQARFGESYSIAVTGDKAGGYQAALSR